MGALATLLREAGDDVTGSDVAFDPPIGPLLERVGVRAVAGYAAAHLDPAPDLVVVGNAIRRENPEARAAEERGLARSSMSGALRERFLAGRRPLVVAGTHGKTTTSAMCAWLLLQAGQQPGWFIGGVPKNLPGAAAIGSRQVRPGRGRSPFVVEGDEYDDVYWSKKPKFLDYVGVAQNEVVILTSVEHDHIDIYPDVASYEDAFRALVRSVPPGGLIVANACDARVRQIVLDDSRARIAFYALEGDDVGSAAIAWTASPAPARGDGLQSFDLFASGSACGRYVLRLPGRHNLRNALAAVAACAEGFAVDLREARSHLASFEGVHRRQDLLGEPGGVRVYDDFGHHPSAVAETLAAIREKHKAGSIWAVFEPRSATACRRVHQEAYAGAFGAADRVLLAPIGRANVPADERLDVNALARALGHKAIAMPSVEAIVAHLAENARSGDSVVVLSNGHFGGIHRKLLDALGERRESGTHA
jgi:UDP-N-acetylmuramate: L-alanyl-gamma-D-glutamyl-meso-diaminopimelate ligase